MNLYYEIVPNSKKLIRQFFGTALNKNTIVNAYRRKSE
jgi:hypothetical protein